jgi:hypothetical protein
MTESTMRAWMEFHKTPSHKKRVRTRGKRKIERRVTHSLTGPRDVCIDLNCCSDEQLPRDLDTAGSPHVRLYYERFTRKDHAPACQCCMYAEGVINCNNASKLVQKREA